MKALPQDDESASTSGGGWAPQPGAKAWAPHGPHVWVRACVLEVRSTVARVALELEDGRPSRSHPRTIPVSRLLPRDPSAADRDRPAAPPYRLFREHDEDPEADEKLA